MLQFLSLELLSEVLHTIQNLYRNSNFIVTLSRLHTFFVSKTLCILICSATSSA